MVKARSPNREKAYELYKNSNGEILLKDIASELGVSESTVRAWKSRDKWNEKMGATQRDKKCNVATSAAKGKKQLKSSKSNIYNMTKESYPLQARPNNKNAVSTGEYEKILFDSMDETEIKLITSIRENKRDLLIKEIQLLTVRERRMLKRIENLKQKNLTLVSQKMGYEKGQDINIDEYEGTLGQIQNIEDALTRVQDRKIKAIESLHKFELDENKLELEMMKFETNTLKNLEETEDTEDDGFIDALKGEIDKVW